MRLAPELARANPEFAVLADGYRPSDGEQRAAPQFSGDVRSPAASLAGRCSLSAAVDSGDAGPTFRERVERAIRLIRERPGRGRRVAVFTSGGFIGTAVQHVLAAPDRAALEFNWRVRNCSLTEFVFTRDRFSLDSFNGVPHLADPSMWTYR